MPCYSPLKGYVSRETGGLCFKASESLGEKMEVACGQCLGCRLDRARMWSARIVHESSLYDDQCGNCFITLTYRDESECSLSELSRCLHVPRDGSLRKSDLQKFLKRLRKRFPQKIRFYAVGEYGDLNGRPHYHACLFNCDFADKELVSSREGIHLFTSRTLEELWPYGFSTIGELTAESAAYCARYCLKKLNGPAADEHYLRVDDYGCAYWVTPEFSTMSLKPGIGRDWYERFRDDVFPSDEVPVPGKGVFKKVPRYYELVLKTENDELYEEVKSIRKTFRRAHGDEYSPERLRAKYEVQKAKMNLLPREV